ncbi:hypothetical protein FXO37_00115 [Capsicum annuum]|nr:hypothetical protein FXO37_00115 [Capsicum annuum]
MDGEKHVQKIVMVPWLAHGHATPFFELAKKLSKHNLHIYLCSTSAVLNFLKQSQENYYLSSNNTSSIELIELHLPSMPELPSHHHSTKGLPNHLYPILLKAFQMSGEIFSKIVDDLNPDLIIENFFQTWALDVALSRNIPVVNFGVTSASSYSFMYHLYLHDGAIDDFPFPELCLHDNEVRTLLSPGDTKSITTFMEMSFCFNTLKKSSSIILLNNWKETEVKYMHYFSSITNKKILSVVPLIGQIDQNTSSGDNISQDDSDIIQWLDKKDRFSTVYVVFGSENVWSKEDIQEIAHGIELSNVNFLWVLRYPGRDGRSCDVEEVLPEGFVKRVKDRGLVVSKWVPHARIMRHPSIGGFLTHCGWNSTIECMHFGVPLIAMPYNIDQFLTAKYVVELGIALEVGRDENVRLEREEIAKAIRNVIAEKKGEELRTKSGELSEKIRIKEKEDIEEEAVEELRKLCLMN